MKRAVVIGGGLAGLLSAAALAKGGVATTCVHFGVGTLALTSGVADIWGYQGVATGSQATGQQFEPVTGPLDAVTSAPPGHPYHAIGSAATQAGLELMRQLAGPELLTGDLSTNRWLSTALGAWRPTCLYPPGQAAGARGLVEAMVVVGLARLKDFYPQLIADNLRRSGLTARAATIDIAARAGEVDTSGMAFARFFDKAAGLEQLIEALAPIVQAGETVALPAVLGLEDLTVWQKVQTAIGHPVCEIPLPPPSLPGWRLHNGLVAAVKRLGVQFRSGVKVTGLASDQRSVTGVTLQSAGHTTQLPADAVILATGGLASGGLAVNQAGQVVETLLDLPVVNPLGTPFVADVFGAQPAFAAGVTVDAAMRPLGEDGEPVWPNLHAVGGLLAGSIRWDELTREGVDAGSAIAAAKAVIEEKRHG